MHEKNIELLRTETLGLVNAELEHLKQRLARPMDSAAAPAPLITRLAVLNREAARLEAPDMTLALTGDKQAARLDLINAVIGFELFAGADGEGLTLPLQVRHKAGAHEPVLHFRLHSVFNALLERVGAQLDSARSLIGETAGHNQQDVEAVRTLLHGNRNFAARYKGAQSIDGVRHTLNSLLRVSERLGIDLLDASVMPEWEWPTIEVEFAYFSRQYAPDARLCLIDLPMPHHSTREALRQRIVAQLGNAAAVVAVMAQDKLLAAETDSLAVPLQQLHTQLRERLTLLVTRSDSKNRQADSTEEVRARVARHVMAGKMEGSRIVPVNVRWGLLANRARQEIVRNGKLPDASRNGWVRDFGVEIFGSNWSFKIRNIDELLPALWSMWRDARFDEALSALVGCAQTQSNIKALEAVFAELGHERPANATPPESGTPAFTQDWGQLAQLFYGMLDDRQSMEKRRSLTVLARENTLKKIRSRSTSILNGFRKLKLRALRHYFNEGMAIAYRPPEPTVRPSSLWSGLHFPRVGSRTRNTPHPAPSGQESAQNDDATILHIKQQHDAQQLLLKVAKAMDCIVKSAQIDIGKTVTQAVQSLRKGVEGIAREARHPLYASTVRPDVTSCRFNVRLPPMGSARWNAGKGTPLSDTLQARLLLRHSVRRKRGVWGTVCKGLRTAEWGWECFAYHDRVYEINLETLREHVEASMQGMLHNLDTLIDSDVARPIDVALSSFFKSQAGQLESARQATLMQWREAKSQTEPGSTT